MGAGTSIQYSVISIQFGRRSLIAVVNDLANVTDRDGGVNADTTVNGCGAREE